MVRTQESPREVNWSQMFGGWRDGTQVRASAALAEDSEPILSSQLSVTMVRGDTEPFSGLWGQQAHVLYTDL